MFFGQPTVFVGVRAFRVRAGKVGSGEGAARAQRVYADRVAGGDLDHCGLDRLAVAGGAIRAGGGAAGAVH